MEEFKIETSVRFGTEALECLKDVAKGRIFIVTDPFLLESKMVDIIIGHLNGNAYMVFSHVEPDPSLELVTEGVRELTAFQPDTVIALGGGSAIDEAKAMMHFSKQIGNLPQMKLIAIPTTSGTGSEVTSFAVITNKEKGIKYPLVDKALLPDVAILDAALVKTLPPALVADTGMDVLTHALEAYVSLRANTFTDALAQKAAILVFAYLVRSYQSADDSEAREQMHYASCLAGLAFDRTSLGVNHAIAHNIGGRFHLAHGRANAILLPHVIAYNADLKDYSQKEYSVAAKKYANLADLCGWGGVNTRTAVKNLIHQIQKMQKLMQMPVSFRACGIKAEVYHQEEDAVIAGALADGCIATNPRPVVRKDIIEMLKKAL